MIVTLVTAESVVDTAPEHNLVPAADSDWAANTFSFEPFFYRVLNMTANWNTRESCGAANLWLATESGDFQLCSLQFTRKSRQALVDNAVIANISQDMKQGAAAFFFLQLCGPGRVVEFRVRFCIELRVIKPVPRPVFMLSSGVEFDDAENFANTSP